MTADYDAPRSRGAEDQPDDSLAALRSSTRARTSTVLDDEGDTLERDLDPTGELSGADITVAVIPLQADEFTCMSCYLVHHHSQLVDGKRMICSECAA